MVDQKPILIAGPPRSGTTLIAGLLAKHGVWIGRGRTTMYLGTNPEFVSENQDIKAVYKEAARQEGYENWQVPVRYMNGTYLKKQDIEQFVPDGKRWLVKTSWNLIFSMSMRQMYPEALWVLPWRDKNKIVDSMNKHSGMAKRQDFVKGKFVDNLQSIQKEIGCEGVQYSTFIETKDLSQISYTEITKLFGFVGIKPDWVMIKKLV